MVTALIEYLTVLLEYIDRQSWEGWGLATPEFGHVTAWYTRVSVMLNKNTLGVKKVRGQEEAAL